MEGVPHLGDVRGYGTEARVVGPTVSEGLAEPEETW